MNYEKAVANIRKELKDYLVKWDRKSLVIGVSGGIDSCLCVALARPVCDELNIPLIGISLPSKTNESDEKQRAKLTGKAFCTKFKEDSIQDHFEDLMFHINTPQLKPSEDRSKIEKEWNIRNGNIKARLRMIYLYNLANLYNGLVLSTDNYTELLLGFWTLHGDVGDYGMIQNLWKTEVYEMAEWLVNTECKFLNQAESLTQTINAMATDGLGVSSLGDLGQIMPEWQGTSRDGYKEVDRILKEYLDFLETSKSTKKDSAKYYELHLHPVIQRHMKSQFKRDNPINISRNIITKE
jgi:NAD+ synthetase